MWVTTRPDGRRVPNAGLFAAFRFLAQQNRITLRKNVAPGITQLPEPNLLGRAHRRITEFVHDKPLGRIRLPRTMDKANVIGELARAFPQKTIVVLGQHSNELKRVSNRLNNELRLSSVFATARNSDSISDLSDDRRPRIVCATFHASADIDFSGSDIVMLLDASHAGHDSAQLALSQVDARFRLYGFCRRNDHHAPSEEDAAMAVFGPEVLDVCHYSNPFGMIHGVSLARISNSSPKLSIQPDDPDFPWKGYWHNERRNRLICQLGKGLAAGEGVDHARFGEVADWLEIHGGRQRSVTILVDRPVHARALATKLPECPLIMTHEARESCPGSIRNRGRRITKVVTPSRYQIVVADAVDPSDEPDVAIWAGGGPALDAIPFPWFVSGTARPMLVVGLTDEHNTHARKLSKMRRTAAYDRDIFPVGISPSQGRLARFLCRQPSGGMR